MADGFVSDSATCVYFKLSPSPSLQHSNSLETNVSASSISQENLQDLGFFDDETHELNQSGVEDLSKITGFPSDFHQNLNTHMDFGFELVSGNRIPVETHARTSDGVDSLKFSSDFHQNPNTHMGLIEEGLEGTDFGFDLVSGNQIPVETHVKSSDGVDSLKFSSDFHQNLATHFHENLEFNGMKGPEGSDSGFELNQVARSGDEVESLRCSLKIKVIDETALIQLGSDVKREKRVRRRTKRVGSGCEESRKVFENVDDDSRKERESVEDESVKACCNVVNESETMCGNDGGIKRIYSKKEMEALRFTDIEAQQDMWNLVFNGLSPIVVAEYDGLVFKPRKNLASNDTPKPEGKKGVAALAAKPSILGKTRSTGDSEDDYAIVEETDSDEDYSSLQRPAFFVEGEPDFESGPPQDGLEYLRRVRWEAKKIPNVKVAKLDRGKLNKEQTVYMPNIPAIAVCPDYLTPLKQWEDAFLAEFSELRLAFSRLEESNAKTSDEQDPLLSIYEAPSPNTIFENFDKLTTLFDHKSHSTKKKLIPEAVSETTFTSENKPTLSVVLSMEPVTRVSMLRKRIWSAEANDTLSESDCLWLFALCATVDTPLDADTCAALRCLLRKCASLRAQKTRLDDEVAILNILAAISGKYFGQSEN